MLPASAAAAAEATRVRPRDVVERDQRGLRSRPGRPRRGVSAFHKCKHEWLCLPGSTPEEAAIRRLAETARRLVEASVSENTRRAYAGALRRLDAWARWGASSTT